MSVRSNTLEPDAMSAIVNCLCPECGGVIELETNRLENARDVEALATGLGTNTSSHSEQGKAIVADDVIDKRQWGSDLSLTEC